MLVGVSFLWSMSKAVRIARVAVTVKIALDLKFCWTSLQMFPHFRHRKLDITGCLKIINESDTALIPDQITRRRIFIQFCKAVLNLQKYLVMLVLITLTEVFYPELLTLVHLVQPFEMDFHFKIPFSWIALGCDTPAMGLYFLYFR